MPKKNKLLKKISKLGPRVSNIAKRFKTTKIQKNKLWLILFKIFGFRKINLLFKNKLINLKHKKAIIIPPKISVKKCAQTTIILKETTNANAKKKYFNLGIIFEQTKAKTKIVEVCPDGNEWKFPTL